MCQVLPTTAGQLRAITDIGKVRFEKYGDEILKTIQNYCHENEITPKIMPEKNPKKSSTQQISHELFKGGMSVFQIAKERNFTVGTIEGYLSTFLETGEIKITDLMPEAKYKELKNILETVPYEGFSDLKSKIDEKFSYGDLRMVFNALQFQKKNLNGAYSKKD